MSYQVAGVPISGEGSRILGSMGGAGGAKTARMADTGGGGRRPIDVSWYLRRAVGGETAAFGRGPTDEDPEAKNIGGRRGPQALPPRPFPRGAVMTAPEGSRKALWTSSLRLSPWRQTTTSLAVW